MNKLDEEILEAYLKQIEDCEEFTFCLERIYDITPEQLARIVEAVNNNSKIANLSLEYCGLKDSHATKLTQLKKLEYLSVANNSMSKKGLEELLKTHIHAINFEGNNTRNTKDIDIPEERIIYGINQKTLPTNGIVLGTMKQEDKKSPLFSCRLF